jgi:WD40 repeat protein
VTGVESEDIVVTIEAEAFTYDEKTGDLINAFNLPGDASMLALLTDSQYGRVGYRQGNIDFIDFREGRIYPEYEIETGSSVRDAVLFKDMMVFSSHSSPEVHIITWHEAPDMEDLIKFNERMATSGVSDDCGYFVLRPSTTSSDLHFCDIDGKELYHFDKCEFSTDISICNDKTYVSDSGSLWVIDPFNKTEEKIELTDYDFGSYNFEMYFVGDTGVAVVWNSWDIAVIDFKNKKKLYSGETDSSIGGALLSSDFSRVYISQGKKKLYAIDVNSGEILEFKDESLKSVANSYDKEFIALSPDDKYIAMCCGDGYVRIADTATMELTAEIPLQSYLNAYLAFTDDGSHLIMQGDDYKVSIWDMQNSVIKNSIDAPTMLSRIVCDDENGLLALCWGSGLVLCNTNGYGYVALANDGMEYLKANHSIVVSTDAMDLKRIYYKDYKSLIELARKQFPDAKLSEEKKVKYNIN